MAVKYLVVHHSATSEDATVEDIRRMHVEGRGWRDIGYHHVIRMGDGPLPLVHPGRPYDTDTDWEPWEYGAHARGHNHQSIGVCLVGNYDKRPLPHSMRTALVMTLAALCVNFGLSPEMAIRGHSELAATACPGRNVRMNEIRAAVERALRE